MPTGELGNQDNLVGQRHFYMRAAPKYKRSPPVPFPDKQ